MSTKCLVFTIAVATLTLYYCSSYFAPTNDLHILRQPVLSARNHPELDGYDYNGMLSKLRNGDTTRLSREIYVDYTGSGVYRDSQMNAIAEDLKSVLYGNPHSDSPSSLRANEQVENMRDRILSWFHTDKSQYSVIFTSGATGALHMVGESFPWSSNSYYYYIQENHNSVLGIRQFAGDHGAHFHVVTEKDMCELPYQSYNKKQDEDEDEETIYNLFAFPAEENFSGKLFPLEYIKRVQGYNTFNKKGRWLVLLDAAAYVPTHSLNLTAYPADFVTISFYKMFGYPTGVGCLIVKNEAIDYMNKVYWGGGSVLQTVSRDEGSIRLPYSFTRRYEDGSPNFYGIMQLEYGFRALEEVGGYDAIEKHMKIVTRYLYEGLHQLRHTNGQPVMEIYGNHEETRALYGNYYERTEQDQQMDIYGDIQGPIVTCNVLTPEGTIVNFVDIEQKAATYNIHVRAGWHCNPGATFKSLNMKEEEVIDQIQEYSCKDSKNCQHQDAITVIHGVLAGGIRLSLGYLTTLEDCDAVIHFFKSNYQH